MNKPLQVPVDFESKFMDNVPDDLLGEILIRLPDCREAIRCGSICKRWLSLVSSHSFVHRFITNHNQQQVSPTTLVIQNHIFKSRSGGGSVDSLLYEVFPEHKSYWNWNFPCFKAKFLNFLPIEEKDVNIRASYDNLLLVSKQPCQWLYICNPITRQWRRLPNAPHGLLLNRLRCGLVCLPYNCSNYRYKVAVFGYGEHNNQLPVSSVFCSETGEWSKLVVTRPLPPLKRWAHFSGQLWYRNHVVAWEGRMHWLDSETLERCQGMVVFNPFIGENDDQHRLQFVALPVETNLTLPFTSMLYFRLGLSQGRLLLSQIHKVKEYCFVLRVWELKDYAGASWSLVHSVELEIKAKLVFVLALHPDNISVVFLWCDEEVSR
ncbi:putative F-box protein At3g23950 isoform X2 [Humulus lupulus]|nr:putative F-box protein At3g23950 isoform X2 [Humulus lupulus]